MCVINLDNMENLLITSLSFLACIDMFVFLLSMIIMLYTRAGNVADELVNNAFN